MISVSKTSWQFNPAPVAEMFETREWGKILVTGVLKLECFSLTIFFFILEKGHFDFKTVVDGNPQ